jgi:hypothetical protein
MRVALLLFVLCALVAEAVHEQVLLRTVQVITLRQGAFTTGRRNSPIPQLTCQNCDDAASKSVVETIQCRNVGYDGQDVNWKCESEIDKHYKLGRTEVSCEGYENPDDVFILAGSCAVEYWLHKVEQATTTTATTQGTEAPLFVAFLFGMLVVAFFIVACCLPSAVQQNVVVASPMPAARQHRQHYATRSTPVYVAPVAAPVYVAPVYDYPVVTTPMYVPSPPVVVHRHTTTVVHDRPSSPPPPAPEKHTSVSHATTKRR